MSGQHSTLQVDGVAIHLVDAGDHNPTLLFLHYWGGSSRTWAPVIDALSSSHRCVAIDFRGWGRSGKEPDDYRLETLAEDVLAVIDRLALDDFIIVGHSMGGKVAQLVAARRSEGLKRLILIAPAPPTGNVIPEEQSQGMIASYQAREGAETAIGILSALPLSDAHRERVIEDTLSGSPQAKTTWPTTEMRKDISAQASTIDLPVQVIVGSADVVESQASLRAAFAGVIPAARFVVLPGVGHLAPLEAAPQVAGAIRASAIA